MSARFGDSHRLRLGWRIRLLLGCYPPWWRVRYDDEMRDTVLALHDEGRWTASGTLDVLRGLVRAWFAPTHVPAEETMTDPTYRFIPRTAWGLLIFVLAGSGFAKVIEDPTFSTAGHHHPALSWCVGALTVAAISTAVVMALSSVPSLLAVLRGRPETRLRDLAPLLVAPASVAVFLLTLAILRTSISGTDPHRPSHVTGFIVLVAVTILGGVATTIAVMRVAMLVPDAPGIAASRRVAMVAVGVLTTVAASSVLIWTIVAATQSPSLLTSDDGLLATPTLVSVVMVIAGLLAAAVLCGGSGLAALSQAADRHRGVQT